MCLKPKLRVKEEKQRIQNLIFTIFIINDS